MTGRLAGRTAVVTGGSSGIGQEIARKLSAEGAAIAVADIDPADETKALVDANGQQFFSARVDVSDASRLNSFADEVHDTLGRVDIVVNNAAVVAMADFETVTWEEWRRAFAVNVDGAFLTTKAFLNDLKQSAGGRVVNISSGSLFRNAPFVTYLSSKGALNGLTYVLATNLAKYDVTVNAIAPSLVRTEKLVQTVGEEFVHMNVPLQDLKRAEVPADVANTVAFLASDDASFITGQIISVDGGFTRR